MMNSSTEIYDFGGKANSLIKLKQNGFNVPNFFVLLSSEFEKIVEYNAIKIKLLDFLKKKDFEKIQNEILNLKFSEEQKDRIFSQFDNLNCSQVAVRSSAKSEDGKNKSFAGQFDTFLFVEKFTLLESIKQCWASAFSKSVREYSNEHLDLFDMNIVIQEMIDSDYSGVGFSLDPTNRSKNYSVIEIVKGVGESLVSGKVTPSTICMQRKIKEIDFSTGEFIPPKEILVKLEENLLLIENLFLCPVDVEWAVKDNILYLLQARPITAFNFVKERFDLTLTREDSLYELELYRKGEYFGILELTKYYYFEPLFDFNGKTGLVSIYYNWYALEENPPSFFRELEKNFENFQKAYDVVKEICIEQKNFMLEKISFDLEKFIENEIKLQPFSSMGNSVGDGWDCSDRVKKILFEFRENFDSIIYQSNEYLKEKILEMLPTEYQKYIRVLSLDEILDNTKINIDELEKRKKGYIYFGGKVYLDNLNKFLKDNRFYIKKETSTDLKGNTAFGGVVQGRVKVVLSVDQFDKFERDDILVTFMTTPKFTPIMKKAKGIITDEGGVTCHAAIVARELKIPCVVAVKTATKILKDGMLVKLNGDTGEIEILEN